MSLGNCHFATDKNTFYIQEIAKGDFRLYNRRFKSAKVYNYGTQCIWYLVFIYCRNEPILDTFKCEVILFFFNLLYIIYNENSARRWT
jgi:hypothetical protein